jgi:hypothetical protein
MSIRFSQEKELWDRRMETVKDESSLMEENGVWEDF